MAPSFKPPPRFGRGCGWVLARHVRPERETRDLGGEGIDFAASVSAPGAFCPDFMTRDGRAREDGRVIRVMYLMRAKRPSESWGEWDLLDVVKTIPRDQGFHSASESECPALRRT